MVAFYLQIWFQAIKDVGAVKSGIMSLPLVLSLIVVSVIAGGLVTAIGYYTPFTIVSTVIASIGAGLITTFTSDTGPEKWISYLVVFGAGAGLGIQQPITAAQTVLPIQDVPTGSSLMNLSQLVGGAIFVSVGQNIFANRLISGLATIPGIDTSSVIKTGATTLRNIVDDPASLRRVLAIYNNSLVEVFRVALGLSCVSFIGAVGMEWKSVKSKKRM